MKKLLLFLVPLILASLTFVAFLFFFNKNVSNKGALQVTANPKSKVYMNGQLLGETPLCKCEYPNTLTIGTYTIRVVPNQGNFEPFEQKITIEKSVLTVIDRTFGNGAAADGSVISLKPLNDTNSVELFVTSFPDKATILLDQSVVGQSPVLLKNVTASDHELTIEKNGYKEKTIHIHTVTGFRLTAVTFLAVDQNAASGTIASSAALPLASLSPSFSPSVSPKVSLSPSASASGVLILQTPTGYLNVRQNPSLSSSLVTKVNPGETYPLLDEQSGWYKIKASSSLSGWISSQYAKKE